ncbi:MAG: hypothetical protein DRG78_18135 [Epsilonproteobacteria bacterium]|nr:MAG: hypothetical protein DRG78_18135 [Campylobacterota bacterium]
MKKIILLFIAIATMLTASTKEDKDREARVQKQIEIEMKKEQKYSKEQTFYQGQYYDLKGAEVNPDSLDTVPEIPVDDFNIDSVYD